MKKASYDYLKLKKNLIQKRNAGAKNPEWKLTPEQVEYVERLGFPCIPRLYRIRTKRLVNVKGKCGIVRDVHYQKVRYGKTAIYERLNKQEMAELRNNGIIFTPYKYEINLRPDKNH